MPFVVNSMTWRIDGVPSSTAVDFQHVFASPGNHVVALTVIDFLGRSHDGSIGVRVLAPQAFEALPATSAIDANLLLGAEFSIFYSGFGGSLE